jgi:hypothetical protein
MAEGTITLEEESVKDRHCAPTMALQRSKLAQRVLGNCSIPLTQFRVWNALETVLSGTPASDDLGITTGTFGTNAPYISTGDLKNAGATTRYARVLFALPADYEAAETVTVRVHAGMVTTVASTTATVDVEMYRVDKDGTPGAADLIGTAATSINSLTADDKDFTVSAATLLPGDQLDIRIAVAVNDTATGTAVIGAVYQVEVLSDQR